MLAITVLIIHLAFVGEIIAQYCEMPQVVQKYFGKLIDHNKQLGSCGNEQHGRPEAALLQLCHKSVGKSVQVWRKASDTNVYDTLCGTLGATNYTPIAMFEGSGRGTYKRQGGAAILGHCDSDGIMVLNQWCRKIDGFGWHFLPIETAKKYYKIRAG